MPSPNTKSTKNKKATKRKLDKSLDSSTTPNDISTRNSDAPPPNIWSTYREIYNIIAVDPGKVQTTEECVANTRVIDVATTKFIDDVQRLDLSSTDHWLEIANILVEGWNKYFYRPENVNNDWSIGDLIPMNRYKTNYFGMKSVLLKRNNPNQKKETQKKRVPKKKDDNSQSKMAKPIQGLAEDKPPLLIEHMETIKSVLSSLCTHSNPSIPYMELVLHPTSYSNTIYNIFAMAFLVREGMVNLTIGNDDEPMVKPLSNFYSLSSSNDDRKKSNFLISLTTEEWQFLVKKLNISDALIPNPEGLNEDDDFFENFTQSQKEKRRGMK